MIDEGTLRKFCATSDVRLYLHAPWREPDGRVVATNGEVLIVLDSRDGDYAPPVEKMTGRIDSLIDVPEPDRAAPVALSTVDLSASAQCGECNGTGKGNDICRSCAGDGEFEHHGHYYECEACDRTGRVEKDNLGECNYCDGTGRARQLIEVGGSLFQSRYLRMLALLPNCVIWAQKNHTEQALFAFDGGRGALMPCRK